MGMPLVVLLLERRLRRVLRLGGLHVAGRWGAVLKVLRVADLVPRLGLGDAIENDDDLTTLHKVADELLQLDDRVDSELHARRASHRGSDRKRRAEASRGAHRSLLDERIELRCQHRLHHMHSIGDDEAEALPSSPTAVIAGEALDVDKLNKRTAHGVAAADRAEAAGRQHFEA